MRKIRWGLVPAVLVVLVVLSAASSGCDLLGPGAKDEASPTRGPGLNTRSATEAPVEPEPAVEPTVRPLPKVDLVTVPDVVQAIKEHEFTNSYEDDPDAIAVELKSFVNGYLEGQGLKGQCVLQPITMNDRQQPIAGTMVPKGTLVRVYVGFGD